jgi:16S rRNA (adenine1518-N6/adenine1519-N6)-dimethyltransferase
VTWGTSGGVPTGSRLLGPADVRALAARLQLRPTKQRGQNFVIDPNTVRRIVRVAEVGPADVVVEVGPGLGSLTLGLLDVVASVLVANLPYNVAVPVLLHLLEVLPSLATVLVMVQAEVADRLAAEPGSRTYGVPSVKARWYADVRRSGPVGRSVFWPVPNVDSGLVALRRREPLTTTVARAEVFAVVDAAFGQRRKTLRAALAGWAGSAAEAEVVLRRAGVDPSSRGEQLTVADFARIAEARLRPVAP